MSFGEEIDLVPLNTFLAATGRLLLPRIAEDRFRLFQVGNLERELLPHPYGILEPNPEMCSEVEIDSVSFVLVPALGFDRQCNRLGYGGGYYDRFLRAKPTIYSVGVGFREQLVEALPISKLDVPVQELYLC
jgi:5-formyltetrahydrofolate cyclo-ligase